MDKQLWQSTTVQGGIVSLISLAVLLFKLDISDNEITALVSGVLGCIGITMTIIGRLKANRNLKVGSTKL